MKLLGVGMLCAAVLATPLYASANDIKSTLESHKGKRVALRLAAGEEITGKVVAVTGDTVHLSELAGRDFFDAIVVIDDVSAVVYRAKEK